MTSSRLNIVQGVAFATIATLSWACNFIAPYVLQGYSIQDFMLVRFSMAGVLGVVLLPCCRAQLRGLRPRQRLTAMGLGVPGYLAYSSCIAGGVIYGGPLLIAAFIGAVPVLQALLGNAQNRSLRWRQLAMPISALALGWGLINLHLLHAPASGAENPWPGLGFSLAAVLLWLSFSVGNQRAMERLPTGGSAAWTCLMMIGAGLAAGLLTPLAWTTNLLLLPVKGFATADAQRLYGWALLIALLSSVVGAWAWNLASQRLPMVLSGQLIALESFFAAVLGLAFHNRLPSVAEATGLGLTLSGTVYAVRVVLGSMQNADERRAAP